MIKFVLISARRLASPEARKVALNSMGSESGEEADCGWKQCNLPANSLIKNVCSNLPIRGVLNVKLLDMSLHPYLFLHTREQSGEEGEREMHRFVKLNLTFNFFGEIYLDWTQTSYRCPGTSPRIM